MVDVYFLVIIVIDTQPSEWLPKINDNAHLQFVTICNYLNMYVCLILVNFFMPVCQTLDCGVLVICMFVS